MLTAEGAGVESGKGEEEGAHRSRGRPHPAGPGPPRAAFPPQHPARHQSPAPRGAQGPPPDLPGGKHLIRIKLHDSHGTAASSSGYFITDSYLDCGKLSINPLGGDYIVAISASAHECALQRVSVPGWH